MPQENAISAPKFNFVARPHLLADGNGNNPHIRTSTSASSPDPFVQDSNSGQTGQNSTDLGPGNLAQPAPGVAFGFGVSADAQGSPSFALANKIGTDKRARIEDDEHTDKANDGKRGARKRRKEDTIHVSRAWDICAQLSIKTCVPVYQDNISSAFLPHGSNQHYYQNTPDRMMYDSSRDFAESQQHMDSAPPAYTDQSHSRPSSPASCFTYSEIPEQSFIPEVDLLSMQTVLGIDVNAFISGRMDKLEANKRKWSECTPEEWEAAGGGEFRLTDPSSSVF